MSSSGIKSPGDVANWYGDRLGLHSAGDALNLGAQYLTFGAVGYDAQTGKLKMGATTHALDETVGEVTGRNIQREALHKQEDALSQAQQDAATQTANSNLNKMRTDIQSSYAARGANAPRTGFLPPSGGSPSGQPLGSDERTFLGV